MRINKFTFDGSTKMLFKAIWREGLKPEGLPSKGFESEGLKSEDIKSEGIKAEGSQLVSL